MNQSPMTIRPAAERGHADHGWLDTHFSFSFAEYLDPGHMGFLTSGSSTRTGSQPGRGFPCIPTGTWRS